MDSATQRIPASQWEHWKETILELSRHNTFKKVVAIMKEDHDFIASPSQYEAQLRTWGYRKNLTNDEWATVFETVDKLKSQRQTSRILISGQEVAACKIKRARRTYNKEKLRNPNSKTTKGRSGNLRNVTIEILGAGGKWSPYANLGDSNEVINTDSSVRNQVAPRIPIGVISDILSASGPGIDEFQGFRPQEYDNIDSFEPEPMLQNLDFSHISTSEDLDMDLMEEESHFMCSEAYQSSSSRAMIRFDFGDTPTGSLDWESLDWSQPAWQLSSPFPLGSLNFTSYPLNDLPFGNLMRDLQARGVSLIKRTSHTSSAHAPPSQNSTKLFLADVNSCFPEEHMSQDGQMQSHLASIMSSLRSLLPSVQGDCESSQSLGTEDEMVQAKLLQILLFSTANAFAGLEGVPIQGVLRYLSRFADINMLLHASDSHVGQSMIENLFRAAIEAKDELALKSLLAFSSIDVNSTLCISDGRKYTPLGRATCLRNLGAVKLLLKAGADVNKTSDLGSSHSSPIEILINDILPTNPIPPEVTEIGEVLIRAGANVEPGIARRALETLYLPELGYSLITSVSDADHSSIICDGFLSLVAGYLNDWQATQATRKIIMACERTKCQRCLIDYKDKVDWALVQGAKRGHLELVRLLLLNSRTPHRALSAAIRSGRKDVVDCILSLNPDLVAPAHSIDDEEWTSESDLAYETITTSFAEAISAEDKTLVHKIEDAGSLKCLGEGERFQPAIAAATKTGNMTYTRKLLDCCPSPTPSQLYSALLYAVHNDHEEAVFTLLAAGADVNPPSHLGRGFSPDALPPSPLFAALLRRNAKIVRAILDADVVEDNFRCMEYVYKDHKNTILGEALQWGDISVIQDVQSTLLQHSALRRNELSDVLERGDMDVFDFVLKSKMASRDTLTRSLEIGLSRGDVEIIRRLVESGADPADSELLEFCVRNYSEMLHVLLELAPSPRNRHIVPDFGSAALCTAVRRGPARIEAVNLLIDCGLVDVSSRHGGFDRPLSAAIETSQDGNHAGFEVIKKLLDAGCDPNSVHNAIFFWANNQTPMLEAIETKSKDLVQLLISRGAAVNREAKLGVKRTPLQKAVEVESLELVILLLEAGADINSKPATRGGATAFQLAAITGNCTIARKLLDNGADIHALPAEINGRWPLEGAAENGRIEMIGFLWKINNAGFDPKQSQRAMELAEGNGYLACRDAIAELSQARAADLSSLSQS